MAWFGKRVSPSKAVSPAGAGARLLLAGALPLSLLCVGATGLASAPPVVPQPAKSPASSDAAAAADRAAFEKETRPFLDKYCVPCHGAKDPRAGVNVIAGDPQAIQKDPALWRRVLREVRDRQMPPPAMSQPTSQERDKFVFQINDLINRADLSHLPQNPGRVLIHRLNRTEYNNTVRDLFGVNLRPADSFPADGSGGGGFDNNADTLYIPPILMERYLAAAGQVLAATPRQRLFAVRPGKGVSARAAAKRTLAHHAYRAWRRPVAPDEVERLLRLYDRAAAPPNTTWESAVTFALKAVLVSPNFLFRIEPERPSTPTGKPYRLNDYELASRLSYFLWASTPDDTLLDLAAGGKLNNPQMLTAQVRRMLKDPRARGLAEGFAGQWLRVRELYTSAQPDPGRYPEFTPALREAMYQEPVTFFETLVKENRSLSELIDSDFTFVNEDLAKLYGLPPVKGPKMRRVALAGDQRGGVLTMAGVLTATSYPRRTSPVLRGKWVLEQILGTPAPPPPQNVATLSPDDSPKEGLTFRQRLEKHREKPECAGCHRKMDPLGFGLENYDVIGKWRTGIGGEPVDSSGVMADGTAFSGPGQLKAYLLKSGREDFVRHMTEQMLAYSLGRGLESHDLPAVRRIMTALEKDNLRTETLILEVAKSYPFQYRSPDGPGQKRTAQGSRRGEDKETRG